MITKQGFKKFVIHGILLTENLDMVLHFKISYLAIGEECRRLWFDM